MATSSTNASRASSKISSMRRFLVALIVGMLAACSSVPLPPADEPPRNAPGGAAPVADESGPLPPAIVQGKSRWQPVRFRDLPGFDEDALHDAWNAWLKSCERPAPAFVPLCPQIRRLSIASADEQRAWMRERLQPYRVEPLQGSPAGAEGLLTGYYEPLLDASRVPTASQSVPLYRPPASLASRRPWFTRQEIDTLPDARAALRGREIAYVADPLDAMMLQIQGSGRLRLAEADGSVRLVRMSFAGTNDQPYRSIGSWLLQQGAVRDASWPGIKAWAQQNPQRLNELLWSNPRVTFFREEPITDVDASSGPRGAQGVALTPGRSIAVDKDSIPYGTPVWLASPGPLVNLQRLVLAQDTGSAIVGAVRADYFTGGGYEAGEIAGRLKQPLRLWVLWPK
ncbi:transglycosylase [Caenimonas koreensis DSM 17982]|uniref:peptidoglycan lytic exotransglycosylase n=1 Tax=Caenimonas koreensis DSM 17982 TaxID=1121255 RepID=A0A844BAK7_9BURK|nr:MltA domain-containing protein [Caenimonas koreensis]MRD48586.1 transglycosylase [Caenimonas koreensis DSM 17982]